MRKTYHAAAIDLGASSGRILLGSFDGETLKMAGEYRMENGFLRIGDGLYWNLLGLYQSILRGFQYFRAQGAGIDSAAVNSWGVDFVLLGAQGETVSLPRCYRDPRNLAAFRAAGRVLPPEKFYEKTGILPNQINTAYQLYAARGDDGFAAARQLLFVPDYLCRLMTGEAATETSIASTSQLLNPATGRFDGQILETLGLGGLQMPEILRKPQVRGFFTKSFSEQSGYPHLPLMAVNSHDTGSAISLSEALPEDELLMNCGTYAILSSIREKPLISAESYRAGLTNEALLGGKFRPACNHSGLFFINQCMEQWRLEGKRYSWAELTAMAEAAKGGAAPLDLDDPVLCSGGNMPALIRRDRAARGLPVPQTDGEIARLIYESLAQTFAAAAGRYEDVAGKKYAAINVVGGGANSGLFLRLLAEASGKRVRRGVVEATAFGNMISQLEGSGEISASDRKVLMRGLFAEEPAGTGGSRPR